jgi:hypothetical protein
MPDAAPINGRERLSSRAARLGACPQQILHPQRRGDRSRCG